MKYILSFFPVLIILQFSLIGDTLSPVEAAEKSEPVLITTYEEDITGDGLKETIELKGILFSQDSKYYREIWADITNAYAEEWRINYQGGYEPKIQFIDVNHDNINDLLYQSATGSSGGLYNNQLHTLKNGKIIEADLPEQLYIKGAFINNFKVDIQISPSKKNKSINVGDQAEDYIQLGIYNKDGQLLKPTLVMIDPIAFYEPILIGKSNGYGLKSYQHINGANHADQIGTIETLWYYQNGDWVILQTDWVSIR